MNNRICKDCNLDLPIENFSKSKFIKKNQEISISYRKVCVKCVNKKISKHKKETGYWKKRYQSMNEQERREYINKRINSPKKETTKEKRKIYDASDKGTYQRYIHEGNRRGRLQRGIEMLLSFEQFSHLINSNCHYCETPNCRGVDRKKSDESYTLENSVPCCKICNRMKLDHSVEQFELHLRKIIAVFDKKR